MTPQDLDTKEVKTWCPGCPNNGILQAIKGALAELVNDNKLQIKDVAVVTGVGCHAKIYDYINVNAFYGLHGRTLPTCLGLRLSNPELKIIGFAGDGATYAEGIAHFIHNCRYNADIKFFVHNNQNFSLTTGQASPVSEKGFVDGMNPTGVKEQPLNPIELALISGATFVARGYALDTEHLKNLMKQAIEHKGFAFIDILQPCIIYHNQTPYLQKNIYKLGEDYNPDDFNTALTRGKEWDYCFDRDQKVPIGVFYKTQKPTFEGKWSNFKQPWYTLERKINWEEGIKEFK